MSAVLGSPALPYPIMEARRGKPAAPVRSHGSRPPGRSRRPSPPPGIQTRDGPRTAGGDPGPARPRARGLHRAAGGALRAAPGPAPLQAAPSPHAPDVSHVPRSRPPPIQKPSVRQLSGPPGLRRCKRRRAPPPRVSEIRNSRRC